MDNDALDRNLRLLKRREKDFATLEFKYDTSHPVVIYSQVDKPVSGTLKLTLQFGEGYLNKPLTLHFVSRCFIPTVQDALHPATVDSNSEVGTIFQVLHTKESPPTYFRTNKFTTAFQEIVDAYGVAKYQEANPGIFTIVTFPFLFAVRFGDWGHGICLLLASLWLIFREKKLGSQKIGDIMEMAFGGRYVILMMSIFSIYCGLVYNEFFSVPFNIFGPSAYECRDASCSFNKSVFSRYLREVPTASHVCNWDYSIRTSNWNGIKVVDAFSLEDMNDISKSEATDDDASDDEGMLYLPDLEKARDK